ncbi:hypothetical protein [Pontitalea aquivivens]|uniref:hypothetical protein n=1 Tax=Pontitalea aquivivens TaxID=3388663 RepID=UPI0039710071
MAEESKSFEGVPLGALFEASQKSLRELKFKIKEEKIGNGRILAKSKVTMSSFGQDIELRMVEIGQSTELKITTSSGQLSDWGEGKKIIESILSQIDIELQKIRDAGRIAPIDSPKYGFGESVTPPPSSSGAQAPVENAPEKKGSGGNWALRVLVAGGLFWLFFTSSGAEFVSSILRSLSVETDIAQYDCDMAASLVEGENLQNAFGGRFRILDVSSLSQVSKTEERIVCTGIVDLSNGRSERMRITVERGSTSSEVRFRVEPL